MNIFFLSLFICTVAVPIAKVPGVQPVKNQTKSNPSLHLSLIERFKKDPTAFVTEMSEADPKTLRTILELLNGLLTTSTDRETHLAGNLATAESKLNGANADVIAAEGVLSDAEQAQTDAAADVEAATGDLAEKRTVQGIAQTEKDDAEGTYNDAIGGLDDEQEVLKKVISILTELLEKQPGVPGGTCESTGITCNGDQTNSGKNLGDGSGHANGHPVGTIGECCDLCRVTDGCLHYAFQKDSYGLEGICWLKDACVGVTKACDGVTETCGRLNDGSDPGSDPGAEEGSDCPDFCMELYSPVCGSDGQTYSNDCKLDMAACDSGGDLYIVHDGEC